MGFQQRGRRDRSAALIGLVAAAVLGVSLAACASETGPNSEAQNTPDAGSEATMENLEDAVLGTWSSDENGKPFLQFKPEGELNGSDGCNGLGGEYSIEDDVVSIKRGASTLMACPGVDDWLRKVSSVAVDGDTMIVMNDAGETIGELQRESADSDAESDSE